jgi:cGMP-dependent protein kinase
MSRVKSSFNVKDVLDSVPLLSSLNKRQKKKLARGLVKQVFAKGEALMTEGEEGEEFFIIVEGKVEVSSKAGGHLAYLGEGDYAGEQALIKSTVRNATLMAVEKTTCLVCNKKTFDRVLATLSFGHRDGKRKAILTEFKYDEEKMESVEEKPIETITWILECVADNLLFLKLDPDQREAVVQHMRLVSVKTGDALIMQGDEEATTFYVTESGTFDILVDDVKVGTYERGGCFGELALLYDSPRAASIVATTDATVWEVARDVFRYQLQASYKKKADDNVTFLKTVSLFKPLLNEELLLVSDALDITTYAAGEIVIKEGDPGEKFYIIKEGVAQWSKSTGESGELLAGTYFGERALRTTDPRAATITAHGGKLILYEMVGDDFNDLLGPVLELVDEKIGDYKKMADEFAAESARKTEARKRESKMIAADVKEAAGSVCGLTEFITIGLLGRGAFGMVTLVEDPHTEKSYALKAIKKHQIIELGQKDHIISEKRVMEKMHNKFLVNLHRTFNDDLRVYFLLDVCLGGELFTILRGRRYFDEPTAQFFTGCVVEAFAYMHSKNIIYRDLKPENLVLDNDGYLKVTDFGFAKEVSDKTFTLCGTPDYLAPEIVTGQGHGKPVDWWTLGVLVYEMLASFPPFFDDEPIETYRKIIRGRVKFPRYFTPESRELIRGLLKNKQTKRLGILKGGAQRIRKHPWFKGFDWDALNAGTMTAPIINPVKDARDLSNFINSEEDEEDDEALPVAADDDFGEEFGD